DGDLEALPCRIAVASVRSGGFDIQHDLQFTFLRLGFDVDASVKILLVDTGIDRLQDELSAMHGGGATVGSVRSGAHPIEVSGDVAIDAGMDVGGLRREG